MYRMILLCCLCFVVSQQPALPQKSGDRKPVPVNDRPEKRPRPIGNPDRTPRPIQNPPKHRNPKPVQPLPEQPLPEQNYSDNPPDNYLPTPEPAAPVYPIDPAPVECPPQRPPVVPVISIYYSPFEQFKQNGIACFDSGLYADAYFFLKQALSLDSSDADLYYYKGCSEVELNFYFQAVQDLDVSLRFFPEDKDALYNRGLAKYFLKEKDEAYYDLNKSAELGDRRAAIFLRRFY